MIKMHAFLKGSYTSIGSIILKIALEPPSDSDGYSGNLPVASL